MIAAGLTAIGIVAAVAASAADLPVKAPPLIVPYSWTGCYVGGSFGSLFAERNWRSAPGDLLIAEMEPTDLTLGIQGGCNYQISSWVLGVQGDYGWTNATGTGPDQLIGGFTDRVKIDSISSATARLGYAIDRFLVYWKAGGAWTHAKYDVLDPTFAVFSSASESRSGWTAGGGFEYAIAGGLSMFIEYDWYDFGTRAITFTNPATPLTNIRERDSVVKVGANWKFGWW